MAWLILKSVKEHIIIFHFFFNKMCNFKPYNNTLCTTPKLWAYFKHRFQLLFLSILVKIQYHDCNIIFVRLCSNFPKDYTYCKWLTEANCSFHSTIKPLSLMAILTLYWTQKNYLFVQKAEADLKNAFC